MSYVKKSLSQDETIKHFFKFHWVVNINIFLFHLLMLIITSVFWQSLSLLSILIFIPSIFYHLSIKSIEQAVTSRRVIYKKGIIARKTEEQILKKVETIEVNQSVLGRLLGYGDVKVTGTGNSSLVFKGIDNPIDVKTKIEVLL